jgi:hypothetical protein
VTPRRFVSASVVLGFAPRPERTTVVPEIREYGDGARRWYLNGKLHRTDGPAFEWANGTREWYLNGKRHRTDGPAAEWSNGHREWWVNGIKYNSKKHGLAAGKLWDWLFNRQ